MKIIAKMWDFQPHEVTNQVWENDQVVFYVVDLYSTRSITWITKIAPKVQKRKISRTIGWGCVFNEMLFLSIVSTHCCFLALVSFFLLKWILFPIIWDIYKASCYKDFIITRSRLNIWFIPIYKCWKNLK